MDRDGGAGVAADDVDVPPAVVFFGLTDRSQVTATAAAQQSPVVGESEHPSPLIRGPLGLPHMHMHDLAVVLLAGDGGGRFPAIEAAQTYAESLGCFDVSADFREIREAACEKGTSTDPAFTAHTAEASWVH
jgi:hypothetical protein